MKNNSSKNYKEWIQKADDDLAVAKNIFKEGRYFAHVCGLCQQVVEKYLKAYIVKTKGEIRKKDQTHKLIYLANLCQKQGLDLLKDHEDDLRYLYEAYIPAKYPLPSPKTFDRADAERLLDLVEEIIEKIKEKL